MTEYERVAAKINALVAGGSMTRDHREHVREIIAKVRPLVDSEQGKMALVSMVHEMMQQEASQ